MDKSTTRERGFWDRSTLRARTGLGLLARQSP
jgi:hypothetical protein